MKNIKHIIKSVCYVSVSLLVLNPQYFGASGTNVTFDNTWNPSGFGPGQNNTFISSVVGTPALTVVSGNAGLNNNAPQTYNNTFYRQGSEGTMVDDVLLRVEGGTLDLDSSSPIGLNNTLWGNMVLSGHSAQLKMSNQSSGTLTNKTGAITLSGNNAQLEMSFNFDSSGTLTNETGAITLSGHNALLEMSNFATNGIVENKLTDVHIESGLLYSINGLSDSTGTVTTTARNITLVGSNFDDVANYGTLFLGGPGTQTTVTDTITLNGGEIAFFHRGNQFGTHQTQTLHVQKASRITITNATSTTPHEKRSFIKLATDDFGDTPITLLTYNTLVGDPNNIELYNTDFTTEVQATSDAPHGFRLQNNSLTVTLAPVAVEEQSNNTGTLIDAINVISQVQSAVSKAEMNFQPTTHSKNQHHRAINQILRMRGTAQEKLDHMMDYLSQNPDSLQFQKFKGNYRLWFTPYFHSINNTGTRSAHTGYNEHYYGFLMGASQQFKECDLSIRATLGGGFSKLKSRVNALNGSKGKHVIAGLTGVYSYIRGGEISTSIMGMYNIKDNQRLSRPDPNQRYLAQSRTHSLALNVMGEINYVFRLSNLFSVRPNVGLHLNWARSNAHQERNLPLQYAQRYEKDISRGGEVYTGV
ncbi:MAG: autotransporter outer membrane beta-barrel domain-containing protein, partial [Alphaproteobacteria bacterium]|nr:autotransporter outer membrane beta-barrel domain-containing protein [Alphaproteobacteria bacterium]